MARGMTPAAIGRRRAARTEQHDDEEEQDDDRAGVDDELRDREELRVEREEEPGDREDHQEQPHRPADRVLREHGARRAEHGDERAEVEEGVTQAAHGAPAPARSAPLDSEVVSHGLDREPSVDPPATGPDVRLELLAELLEVAERGHRHALTERADGVAHDAVRDVVEGVELLHRAGSVHELLRDAEQPARALAARRALTARFVAVELHQVVEAGDGVRALRHHRRAAGAEHRSHVAERVDPERNVEDALAVPRVERALLVGRVDDVLGAEHRRGRAARDDRVKRLVAEDAAADVVDELAERDPDAGLDDLRLLHVAIHPEEADAAIVQVVNRRELRELLAAERERGRDRGDGLEVVHRRGAPEGAGLCGEGRLQTGLAAATLERVEERGLLAADVRARAGVDDGRRPPSWRRTESCRGSPWPSPP